MRIREGDPLEIFTDKEGSVIFRKYSLMDDQSEFAQQICDALHRTLGGITAVTDRDSIIACAGKKDLAERRISPQISKIMEDRQMYQPTAGQGAPLCEGEEKHKIGAAAPIISGGDVLGAVVCMNEGSAMGETEGKLVQTMAAFLGRHMEH